MRAFGKTPRPSTWQKIWNFMKSMWEASWEYSNLGGHQDRMEKRKRKTRFDRW